MTKRGLVLLVGLLLAMPGSASASTLQLSASPTSDSSGFPAATITAVGVADPPTLGLGTTYSTVDVFAAQSGSVCAVDPTGEAVAGGSELGPKYNAQPGPFFQTFTFDPQSSTGGIWTLCGYLTDANEAITTAETTIALPPLRPTPPLPPPPTATLRVGLSRRTVSGRNARIAIAMTGALSSTAAPAVLIANLEYGRCDRQNDFTPDGQVDFTTRLRSTGDFQRSFSYRPRTRDGGYFSTGGEISVCVYVGRVWIDGFGIDHEVLYAQRRAVFRYKAPPHPTEHPSKPTHPTQLQQVENAVTHAIPDSGIYMSNTYSVQTCRKIGPDAWSCVVTSTTPGLPVLVVIVREIAGRYYVGQFAKAPW